MSWEPEQQKQYYNSQLYDDSRWVGGEGEGDSNMPKIVMEQTAKTLSPVLPASENIGASTLATSTSTSKTIGVKSAFLSSPPPLTRYPSEVSSATVRHGDATVGALLESSANVEGSHQLVDDSVSLSH